MKINNFFKDHSLIDISSFLFLIIFSLGTLIISFNYEFDISGGGASSDINTHWKYIQILNLEINNLVTFGVEYKLTNFPLHHVLVSRFDFLSSDLKTYLNFFFYFSLTLPLLFYLNIKKLFPQISNLKILFYSFLILLLPNFQASAIWGSNHITSLIFFLASIFFLNFNGNSLPRSRINIFLIIFFLSLTCYVRQYYVIFFPFFILKILETNKTNFLYISFLLIILSLPGFLYLSINPKLLFFDQELPDITNFYSSIIIVLSIIGFFLLPFFILDLKENLKKINFFLKKKSNLLLILFLTSAFILLCFNFKYEGMIGGGIFYKLSNLVFKNNLFLFIVSFLSLFILISFKKDKYFFLILIIPIIISFGSGFYIFQKYFDPLIYLIFFLLFNKRIIENILNKQLIFPLIYFSIYWLGYCAYASNFFDF